MFFISTYHAYHKDYSFGPHANPVKEVWNNGRLHLRAVFFPHANSANLAKVYFITFKLL